MDNLRAAIDVLFNHTSPEHILDRDLRGDALSEVNQDWFRFHFGHAYRVYTNDQIYSIYQLLVSKWMKYPDENQDHQSLLNVPLHFTKDVLTECNSEPACKYEHLLRWREVSLLLGEDVLTTSYLANQDLLHWFKRTNFSWRPVITHNNTSLQNITDKGMAELHFHLGGSTLIFDLNWLSLMNDISHRGKQFKNIKTPQTADITSNRSQKRLPLHDLVVIAADIRTKLFAFLTTCEYPTGIRYNDFSRVSQSGETQRKISELRYKYGKRYNNQVIDYAIPSNLSCLEEEESHIVNSVLSGERRLLYQLFRHIYGKATDYKSLSNHLFLYLLIKNKFRQELIQVDKRVGFDNFKIYQDRKSFFLKEGSIFEKLVEELAFKTTFNNQRIDYLEARIAPTETTSSLYKKIKQIDDTSYGTKQTIKTAKKPEYYYICHFIKSADKTRINEYLCTPRHSNKRIQVKKQAISIGALRDNSPSVGRKLVGIDAASSEMATRPEVFAQAYRYLRGKKHKNEFAYFIKYQPSDLGFTYHVGEDFPDIADGLRAIDEVLHFMNFTHSDRLGHALALATDSGLYYQHRNHYLTMSRQNFLDNVVWMKQRSAGLGIQIPPRLNSQFESWAEHYSQLIYGSSFTAHNLYQSWLLRGDDPLLYRSKQWPPNKNEINLSWNYYGLNNGSVKVTDARKNETACNLYHEYHYNPTVRKKGSESIEMKICNEYIDIVSQLQRAIRVEISERHVAIESNPSSNYKIGEMQKYQDHPMVNFYNVGLNSNLDRSVQISTSINTDDQGVFATSLENEFALMACAVEKAKDQNGKQLYINEDVYRWLNNIRIKGFEQRFVKKNMNANSAEVQIVCGLKNVLRQVSKTVKRF